MIKLDRAPETSETKPEVSNSYLNIKPKERMSDQELADSISKEFEDARNMAEMDDYDRLISEVFNCSEEDIDIDFHFTEEISNLLENFKPDKWDKLDVSEKAETINNLTKAIGEALQLDSIPGVVISDGDDAYGFYDAKNNSIVLNSRFLADPIELVNTIAHELRHAFQHMRAEKLETWEDARYRVNLDNYISPAPLPGGGWLFFMDYYYQYVEVDARVFANKFTEAMI